MEYKLRITDIMTLRPYIFVIGGVLLGCVVAWLLINYISDNLLLLASLFLYLCAVYVLIILVRIFYNKTVIIEYTDNEIVLQIGRKEKRCRKTDLLGFYSFDYIQELLSTISFQFVFKDGYRLDISDYTLKRSSNLIINEQKNSELKRFLIVSMNYFEFSPIKKVRWRTWMNICNIWYSKQFRECGKPFQ